MSFVILIGGLTSKREELMARVVPLSSAVVYTSLCWGGSLQLLFLVYVWLSCRAVSAVVCIESIPAYAGVVVCGCHFWCMSGSLAGQLFSQI